MQLSIRNGASITHRMVLSTVKNVEITEVSFSFALFIVVITSEADSAYFVRFWFRPAHWRFSFPYRCFLPFISTGSEVFLHHRAPTSRPVSARPLHLQTVRMIPDNMFSFCTGSGRPIFRVSERPPYSRLCYCD